jgi:hypothetical protein
MAVPTIFSRLSVEKGLETFSDVVRLESSIKTINAYATTKNIEYILTPLNLTYYDFVNSKQPKTILDTPVLYYLFYPKTKQNIFVVNKSSAGIQQTLSGDFWLKSYTNFTAGVTPLNLNFNPSQPPPPSPLQLAHCLAVDPATL